MLYEVIPHVMGSTFIMDDRGNIIRRSSDISGQIDSALIDRLVNLIPPDASGFFDTSF